MGEDLGFDFGAGQRGVAVLVALVAGGEGVGADSGAVGIDVGGEDDGL